MPTDTPPRSRQAERSEATKQKFVDVALKLFGDKGFAATSIEDITNAAELTRGALYYHFDDKAQLFEAVYDSLSAQLAKRLRARAETGTPDSYVRLGAQEFLDACLHPAARRIALLDAPAVLSAETIDELDSRHVRGLLAEAVEAAMKAGAIERQPAGPLTDLLMGAMHDAGLRIARAPDPAAARREYGAAVDRLLDGLTPRG